MTEGKYQVQRMLLNENDANRLGKWASLWADLLHVEMVLHHRGQIPDDPANVFLRRALWESAIVSYGRMEASDRRRKLDHHALLQTARGDRGDEFHQIVMGRRHEHVAHRLSRDLETITVIADYSGEYAGTLDSICVSVSAAGGPRDDSALAAEFTEHVQSLKATLWRDYLAPPAAMIAARGPSRPTTCAEQQPADRMTASLTLWSRNGDAG